MLQLTSFSEGQLSTLPHKQHWQAKSAASEKHELTRMLPWTTWAGRKSNTLCLHKVDVAEKHPQTQI